MNRRVSALALRCRVIDTGAPGDTAVIAQQDWNWKSPPTGEQFVNVTREALCEQMCCRSGGCCSVMARIGDDYVFDQACRSRGSGCSRWTWRARNIRMHLDVAIPHDQAEARIAAALATGGRLVSRTDVVGPGRRLRE